MLLIGVLSAALLGSGATSADADDAVAACNGDRRLCDRRLNEVAFAATHNAMSAATYPEWLFAQQEAGLSDQLRDGVRALLIDAHYGRRVGDRVLTDLDDEQLELAADELGEAGIAAARRIRDRLLSNGKEPGPRTAWLCHIMCELGAIPLERGFREIRDFVVEHPGEVLIVIVEDDGPTPRDIAQAVEASGLLPFVYKDPPGDARRPWPTLREMIDSGGRVLIMAEKQGGDPAVPWYLDGYASMQETPYRFSDPSKLSCEPNRGKDGDGTLFLLNHWIDTYPIPRVANAARMNDYDTLLTRARRCERERGLMPNIIAVDLYRTGDLLKVVDALNRTPREP